MAISELVFCPVSSKQSSALAMHLVNFSKRGRSINNNKMKRETKLINSHRDSRKKVFPKGTVINSFFLIKQLFEVNVK